MNFVFIFVFGLLFSFVSAMPPGPINMGVSHWIYTKQFSKINWFLFGVILTDVLIANIAIGSLVLSNLPHEIFRVIGLFGGAFFILFGIYGLFKRNVQSDVIQNKDTILKHKIGFFLRGVLFCGLNPGFFLFWIFVAVFIIKPDSIFSFYSHIVYSMGIILGNTVWFFLFFQMIKIAKNKISYYYWKIVSHLLIFLFGILSLVRVFLHA